MEGAGVTINFFVSYNSADRPWAEWIAWILEEQGYSVIIQAWDFRPGGNFILDMQKATESERTIIVLSESYLQALYTQPEWAAAFKQDPTSSERKLLPIRVAPCKPQGMLAPIVYVDLVGKTDIEAEQVLLDALKDRAKPLSRPAFPSVPERVMQNAVAFPGSSSHRRRESYARQLAQLEDDVAAVEADLATESSGGGRLKLKRKLEQLHNEIEELEEKLDEKNAESESKNVRDRNLEKALQKIDFVKAKEIARTVKASLNQDGGAVLFFLQKSKKQMGTYCVEEVLDVIMADEIIDGKIVVEHRRIPIDLGSAISQCNEVEFLTLLGSYFNIDASEDMLTLSQSLRKAIQRSINDGTTIFLEIKGVDDLIEQEKFLGWFVDEFWKPLIDVVTEASKKYKNKFIVALIADSHILPDCSSNHFCQCGEFDAYKLLELPLPNWTVDDVREWLIRFRVLSAAMKEKTDIQLKKIAEKVYRDSDGTPQNVCANLREQFL